jgi:hypothetical protein
VDWLILYQGSEMYYDVRIRILICPRDVSDEGTVMIMLITFPLRLRRAEGRVRGRIVSK